MAKVPKQVRRDRATFNRKCWLDFRGPVAGLLPPHGDTANLPPGAVPLPPRPKPRPHGPRRKDGRRIA